MFSLLRAYRINYFIYYFDFSILNENFGLVEIKGVFALFDTFDLYVSQDSTAAEVNKSIEDCVKVGQDVIVNACLIGKVQTGTKIYT